MSRGTLRLGEHRARKIHQIDPATGKLLRSIASDRLVTGVTWIEGANGAAGELWHATWETDASELRRIDAAMGEVLESLEMPAGANISGPGSRRQGDVLLRRRE